MIEALIVMSIIYCVMYLPLRGKTLDQLTQDQLQKVYKQKAVLQRRKPEITDQQTLESLQKNALVYLVMAIVLPVIEVALIILVYPGLFA